MSIFYQVAFWALLLVVAWLVLVVVDLGAAIKGQDGINDSTLDCLMALQEYIEKQKGATK